MLALVPRAPAADSRMRAHRRVGLQPVVGAQLLAIDSILRRLAEARSQLLPASACAAREIVSTQAWFAFGYARASDFARERWGRTGRWLHDRASLGEVFRCFPRLEQAATGEDGKSPIGSAAALLVGRVATTETLEHWIARARTVSVRALRAEVSLAGGRPREVEAELDTVSFTLRMPTAIRVAFEETLELHRAVVGKSASVGEFLEALIAESSPAAFAGEPDHRTVTPPAPSFVSGRFEARDEKPLYSSPAFQAALDCLDRVEQWTIVTPGDGMVGIEGAIRELLRLEDEIETRIGELLVELDEHRAWHDLACEGLAAYAEKCLGLSRTTAWRRTSIVRQLRGLEVIRRAYLEGSIGIEAAHAIQRGLGGHADVAAQRGWLARARSSTLKRLHDESMVAFRERLLTGSWVLPPSDEVWHESRRRVPGRGLAEVIGAGCRVLDTIAMGICRPDVFLHVRLPPEQLRDLEAAIEERRLALAQHAEHLEAMPVQMAARIRPSLRIAGALRRRYAGVPSWVGFLAMLEEYACTWDTSPRRAGDATYERAGYRCEAPGCTSRRNLEAHHVRYRSRRGKSELENLACLCRMHHQMGEHGGRARVRGRAPLGMVWRLGVPRLATWFRNEMRLEPVG